METVILATSWTIMIVLGSYIVVGAQCPAGCSECSGLERRCVGCLERYRLDGDTCVPCPERCLNCSADNTCQQCQAPYYGTLKPQCTSTCPEHCDSRGCDMNGLCFGCQSNFYGDRCRNPCYLCKNSECDMYSCRNGCISGYYERAYSSTNHLCLSCPYNCKDCTYSTNCFQCIDGFTAVNSYACTHCSVYIPYCLLCSNNNGSITCRACQERYYLENNECRNYTCPNTCQGDCTSDGMCIAGCLKGFTGTRCEHSCLQKCQSCAQDDRNVCTNCTGNFYTSSCTVPCSSNCIVINGQSTCSFAGHCFDGCLVGYWGSECNHMCPANCNACEQISGACLQCKRAFYGQVCERRCSSNCIDTNQSASICTRGSGYCLQGCELGFTGSHCNISASSTVIDASTTTLNIYEDSSPEENMKGSLNAAVIGSATASGVVVIGMLIGIGVFCLKRRSRLQHSPNSMYVSASVAVTDNPRNKNMYNGGSGMEAEQSTNPSLYETLSPTVAGSEYSVLPAQNAEVSDTPSGGNSPTIYYNIT